MTADQLIAELSKLPPDVRASLPVVFIAGDATEYSEVERVTVTSIANTGWMPHHPPAERTRRVVDLSE